MHDAIKNPLRLALLCRSWSLHQGKLPSTKASLYQQFTNSIYAWKQERFLTNLAQRQQLDRALSQLALQAIANEQIRFRLPQHFVLASMEPEQLELALQLGWLSQVGIAVKTGEQIYAFYHSTFQEYFATQAIANWQLFFSTTTASLPIFRSYWHETILFWFGRVDIATEDKQACIDALIT